MARPQDERPLRVVFCHYAADFGGGSDRSLFDIATHLPGDRFSVAMILKTGDPLADEYRQRGIDVVELPLQSPRGNLRRYALGFLPSLLRVRAAIRRLGADVVHVNTLYNIVGAVAARLAGRPLVWHVREILPESKAVQLFLWLQRLLAARAVAISNAVAATMRVGPGRLRVIYNGIDLSEYADLPNPAEARRALGIERHQPVVSTIGRIEPWKGQRVLVDAAPRIINTHPSARILVVGAPALKKPDYYANLLARCKETGIEDFITFTGPRCDIPAVLAASDVLVLPTVTPEPFGRTVVEAMAARCPVVATAAGGPLETVVDGETGLLVPPDDPEALAEAVLALLDNPARARSMGEKGRQRAFEQFSLDRLVNDMAGLFEETAGRRGGSVGRV